MNEKVEAACCEEERGLFRVIERETEVMSDLIDCPILPINMHSDVGFPSASGEDSVNAYWCNGVQWEMLRQS